MSQLKKSHLKKPYNQDKSYELRGVWFLTHAENRAIRSPYAVVLSYLKELCKRGVVAEEKRAKTFRILASAADIWVAHRKDQKKIRVNAARADKGKATLQALLGDVFPGQEENKKAEQERKERGDIAIQPLEYSVNDANAIAAAGFTAALFCLSCQRHHLPEPINECTICYSHRLRTVDVTEEYLHSLPPPLEVYALTAFTLKLPTLLRDHIG